MFQRLVLAAIVGLFATATLAAGDAGKKEEKKDAETMAPAADMDKKEEHKKEEHKKEEHKK